MSNNETTIDGHMSLRAFARKHGKSPPQIARWCAAGELPWRWIDAPGANMRIKGIPADAVLPQRRSGIHRDGCVCKRCVGRRRNAAAAAAGAES